MEAGSLLDLFERSKHHGRWPLTESVASQLVHDLLFALELMHRETPPRLCREVAPSRVQLSADGVASLTAQPDGVVAGLHMSLEQARGRPLDLRADVFSAGALLFELTCGRPPAASVSALALGELDAPRKVRPALSEPLAAVLE